MSEQLYLFQIGPVQSFIAAARRTQDLYVGSRMLSMIASAGVRAALATGATLVFPALDSNGNLPTSVPHRFAFVSDRDDVAAEVEAALHQHWQREVAGKVRDWLAGFPVGKPDWLAIFDRQVANWLEVYWVGVPYSAERHSACYREVGRLMAARKAARHFVQVDEPGVKCTLTGAQSALPLDWNALRTAIGDNDLKMVRENERLGAIATVKRFAQHAGVDLGVEQDRVRYFPSLEYIATGHDDAPDDVPAYLAILHMDGDRMGERLSDPAMTWEHHRDFTYNLAIFAEQRVPALIWEKAGRRGALVYAGGDDVLALLPLESVLECADAIRSAFAEQVGGTMSAGIAVMSAKSPFDSALDEARRAEKRAKDAYGRNALVVRDVRSSAIREAGANWTYNRYGTEGQFVELLTELQTYFAEDRLSGKLGYDLLNVAHQMGGAVPPEARAAEVRRLIGRRTGEGDRRLSGEAQAELADALVGAAEVDDRNRWESVANWTILARFLSKGGRHA